MNKAEIGKFKVPKQFMKFFITVVVCLVGVVACQNSPQQQESKKTVYIKEREVFKKRIKLYNKTGKILSRFLDYYDLYSRSQQPPVNDEEIILMNLSTLLPQIETIQPSPKNIITQLHNDIHVAKNILKHINPTSSEIIYKQMNAYWNIISHLSNLMKKMGRAILVEANNPSNDRPFARYKKHELLKIKLKLLDKTTQLLSCCLNSFFNTKKLAFEFLRYEQPLYYTNILTEVFYGKSVTPMTKEVNASLLELLKPLPVNSNLIYSCRNDRKLLLGKLKSLNESGAKLQQAMIKDLYPSKTKDNISAE